jgi:hypothetical protein
VTKKKPVTGRKECVATANRIRVGVVAAIYPESRSGRLYKRRQNKLSVRCAKKDDKRTLTLDLLGIRRTCIMCVYLLCGCALVERDEAVEEVVACGIVVVSTVVVWEVVT